MARPTLLAVSHGTSDAEGSRAVAEFVESVIAALPGVDVQSAFVDVQQPDSAELAPTIEGPLVIVPLLLSNGFHVGHDLHGITRTRAQTVVADPMGPDPRLAEVLAQRLGETRPPASDRPVILAVAGSRDPRSLADAEGMAELLGERLGRGVELAYLAARKPDLASVVAQHPDAVVSTYLLARGYFFNLAVRRARGATITPPLLDGGSIPRPLVDLVVSRYLDAEARFPS